MFFLFIFLFQVGGYYLVFWAMDHRAKSDLLQRLDAGDYNSKEAIVLTIPFTMPYPVYQDGYERVDGDFEYNGESFKLIKQKLENDTLFIVCIKDRESTRIAAAYSDFTKVTHNHPVSSKKAISFLTKIYKDFKSTEFKMLYKSRLMYERTYFAVSDSDIKQGNFTLDSPPPELVL
jgi:hypothetical protein